jgi:ABC-type sugar transport system substrate-binding protein
MAALLAVLTGCTPVPRAAPAVIETPVPRVYALVVKDIVNPYMLTMFDGFKAACAELGAEAVLSGPEIASAEDQA